MSHHENRPPVSPDVYYCFMEQDDHFHDDMVVPKAEKHGEVREHFESAEVARAWLKGRIKEGTISEDETDHWFICTVTLAFSKWVGEWT